MDKQIKKEIQDAIGFSVVLTEELKKAVTKDIDAVETDIKDLGSSLSSKIDVVDLKVDTNYEELNTKVEDALKIATETSKQEGKAGKDGKDGRDGVDGKTVIVDKVIEKTEVIIKEPTITRTEVKVENPFTLTGEEVVNKINELETTPDKQIDAKHIKNLPKLVNHLTGGTNGIKEIIAGSNITVDNTRFGYPVVSSTSVAPDLTPYAKLDATNQPFTGNITAPALIKTGGTSSQFLKADGTVDTSTYFVLPSLTSGSVLFSNGSTIAQDNSNFFWDDTNNRLGIGTASPSQRLHLYGSTGTGGEIAIRIENAQALGYSTMYLYGDNSNVQFFKNGSTQTSYAGSNSFNIYQSANAPISFYTNGNNERFRIQGDGKSIFYGRLTIPDGTAANPSIGFTSDDDGSGTGFYRSSANRIGVATDGVFRGQFLSTGFEMAPGNSFTWDNRGGLAMSSTSVGRWSCAAGNFARLIIGESNGTGFSLEYDATNLITSIGNGVGISTLRTLRMGGQMTGYVAKTTNYTLTTADYLVNCTANSFNITLPTAVGFTGQIYKIKNSGTGTITVATTSSQTIDGQLTQTLNQYDSLEVMSNGANWLIN